jgi:excisionase family DNA binding protein
VEEIELMPLKEVQKILHISKVTLWKYVKNGKISVVRFSPRKVLVRKEEIDRFIRDSETTVQNALQ